MFQEKRITLKNIAEMAGVSKAAVSGVLNNSLKINCSKSKREHIFQLVKTYDYAPQSVARALSTKRTYQIGFMVSTKVTLGIANAFFSTLMAGVQHVCQQRGYLLTVTAYDLSNFVTGRSKWATQGRVKTGQEKSLLLFKTAYINVWVIGCFEK